MVNESPMCESTPLKRKEKEYVRFYATYSLHYDRGHIHIEPGDVTSIDYRYADYKTEIDFNPSFLLGSGCCRILDINIVAADDDPSRWALPPRPSKFLEQDIIIHLLLKSQQRHCKQDLNYFEGIYIF